MRDALRWVDNVIGSTHPWRVADVDDVDDTGNELQFIVKHFRAGDLDSRVTEYLCGSLAADLEPYTVKPTLVTFTPEFLASLERLPQQPQGLSAAEPGVHVAYPWIMGAATLFYHPTALSYLRYPHQVADIVGCDVMLQNWDRGEDNVLVEPGSQGKKAAHILRAIDWENAIAGHSLSAGGLVSLSMASRALLHGTADVLLERISGAGDFDHFRAQLSRWEGSTARAQMLIQGVPREWGVPPAQLQALATYLLARVPTTMLRLAQPDDPDRVFPNWQHAASF